ncbi:tyrosine-type recombinase/integrase [Streptomyces sp. NBC_00341]|uniref:tyrosine-type recombinase/integrase n=1 Tax=Streptomyces sp. NBC_00341 TaxID=2975717 RepID=UPI00308AC4A6|nr:tyrosine-type recombinase/integrase [Streptomyces sp. NBC_00341]
MASKRSPTRRAVSGLHPAAGLHRAALGRGVRAEGEGHLKLKAHKLRHTAASLAIGSGADINVVQTMLGHKSATLTLDTYGHLFPDRLDEVSKKMHSRRV